MSQPQLPILIIGTGLSGLTLAQGLKLHGIPFHLYERDSSSTSRSQGYRIRLHDPAFDALERTLGPELYETVEKSCAIHQAGMGWTDAVTGEVMRGGFGGPGGPGTRPGPPGGQTGPGGPPGNPPIQGNPVGPPTNRPPGPPIYKKSLPADRSTLRQVLQTSLEEYTTYSKQFQSYTETPNGIIANFTDGTSSIEGSLLVGADGTRSVVANSYLGDLLTPFDLRQPMIYGKTPITTELLEEIKNELMKGMNIVSEILEDGSKVFMFLEAMRFNRDESASASVTPLVDDYIYWVLSTQQETIQNHSQKSPSDLSKILTKNWSTSVLPVITYQDVSKTAILNMRTSHPTNIPTYPSNKRITLMGDAIHTMPPTGGSGANIALKDAALLCEVLVKTGGWGEGVVREYEEGMRGYVQEAVGASYRAAVGGFGVRPLKL